MPKHYTKKLARLSPINPFVDIYVFYSHDFYCGFPKSRKKKLPDLHFLLAIFKMACATFIILLEK